MLKHLLGILEPELENFLIMCGIGFLSFISWLVLHYVEKLQDGDGPERKMRDRGPFYIFIWLCEITTLIGAFIMFVTLVTCGVIRVIADELNHTPPVFQKATNAAAPSLSPSNTSIPGTPLSTVPVTNSPHTNTSTAK